MKKSFSKIFMIFLLVSAVYATFRLRGVKIPFLDTCFSYCTYPILSLQKAIVIPINQYFKMFEIHREMETICQHYVQENQELLKENIELTAVLEVAERLKEVIEFKARYKSPHVLTVQVIARHFGDQHFFYIDAGKNRGVTNDMVVVYKNCLVGRVNEVFPYYSSVTLITDPSCKVAAFCKNSLDHAIHEGCGALDKTKLTYVFNPQLDIDKRLKKGDLVLSSGEGLIFPKGFGLGKIEDFHANDLQLMVTVKPLIDFNTIEYCCVIEKGAEYIDLEVKEEIPPQKIQKEALKKHMTPQKPSDLKKPAPKIENKNEEVVPKPLQEPLPLPDDQSHLFSPLKLVEEELQ